MEWRGGGAEQTGKSNSGLTPDGAVIRLPASCHTKEEDDVFFVGVVRSIAEHGCGGLDVLTK